ncbi:hypothetical protein E2C01_091319 [Portunus trituberculatus]|uniref:Uncharacterized protein n=1 Tax=Portunus trituberculatus TaxID=210409 RepID=A0A5B7JDN6_PORTR|nr:hypothetical protein [Portunus trituberculatus]
MTGGVGEGIGLVVGGREGRDEMGVVGGRSGKPRPRLAAINERYQRVQARGAVALSLACYK